jgi:hypothetical protein
MMVESKDKIATVCRYGGSAPFARNIMNKLSLAFVAMNFVSFALKAAQPEINPSHIDVYVTPYYDSKGPTVSVGRFSSGLASAKEADFLEKKDEIKRQRTERGMEEKFSKLTSKELPSR